MNFKNLFKGCPGLQFRLGNGCALASVLLLFFLFCAVIYVAVPILWGFFTPFALAGVAVDKCCCYGFNRCIKRAPCWLKPIVVIAMLLLILIFYLVLWVILEAIMLSLGSIGGALAGAILTVPTMLYIIFFSVKLVCLRCRRLK